MQMRPVFAIALLLAMGCAGRPHVPTLPAPQPPSSAGAEPEAPTPQAVRGVIHIQLSPAQVSFVFEIDQGEACVQLGDPAAELHCATANTAARWQVQPTHLNATALSAGQLLTPHSIALQTLQAPPGSTVSFEFEAAPDTTSVELVGGGHFTTQAPPLQIVPSVFALPGVNGERLAEVQHTARTLGEAFGALRGSVMVAVDGETGPGWINILQEGTLGPALLLQYLDPLNPREDPESNRWVAGLANHLWSLFELGRENIDQEEFRQRWLDAYARLRRKLDGRSLFHSQDAGEVVSLCIRPETNETPLMTRARAENSLAEILAQRFLPDMSTCLADLGWRLAIARFELAPAEQLLRIRALSDGLVVLAGRGFFEPGDRLVAVARQAVSTREDVAWALRDVEVGSRFTVRVRRDGRLRTTWATRPRSEGPIHTRFFLQSLQ